MEALSDKLLEMCANLKVHFPQIPNTLISLDFAFLLSLIFCLSIQKKNTSQLDSLSSDDYDTKLKNYHQGISQNPFLVLCLVV